MNRYRMYTHLAVAFGYLLYARLYLLAARAELALVKVWHRTELALLRLELAAHRRFNRWLRSQR